MNSFWKELESLAASTVETVVPVLLEAYLSKSAGIPGATPMTIGNIGNIAGAAAAAAVLQHLAATQVPAPAAT